MKEEKRLLKELIKAIEMRDEPYKGHIRAKLDRIQFPNITKVYTGVDK